MAWPVTMRAGTQTKAVYVGFKFRHMGDHAGYDLVRRHAGYDFFIDCQKEHEFLSSNGFLTKCWRHIFGIRLWRAELRCLLLALWRRRLTFHFIYAENIFRYLGRFKWLGFRIVCTYHQPSGFYTEEPALLAGIDSVDEVIVLDAALVDFFKERKGDDHVHYIPHGVDTEFFAPDPLVPRRRELLMVGNWYRNFAFAAEVFTLLLQQDPLVECHIVAGKKHWHHFGVHKRLHLYCDISDQELLFRYRSAALLFLPLDNFVANNAVLEALASGCTVLIASEQELSMPLKKGIEHVPLSLDPVVTGIRSRLDLMAADADTLREDIVRNFSWHAIGEQTGAVLRKTVSTAIQD